MSVFFAVHYDIVRAVRDSLKRRNPMSELVTWLKAIYAKAQENKFEWKPLYPNNMPCNGKEGCGKSS